MLPLLVYFHYDAANFFQQLLPNLDQAQPKKKKIVTRDNKNHLHNSSGLKTTNFWRLDNLGMISFACCYKCAHKLDFLRLLFLQVDFFKWSSFLCIDAPFLWLLSVRIPPLRANSRDSSKDGRPKQVRCPRCHAVVVHFCSSYEKWFYLMNILWETQSRNVFFF